MGGIGAALIFVLAIVLLIARGGGGGPADELAEEVSVEVTGAAEKVFDWSSESCSPDHYPDIPARAFRDHRDRVQLVIANVRSRRLIGPGLDRLRVDCRVVFESSGKSAIAAFNDQEWLASLWTRDGRNVVALVHDEYHRYRDPDRCPGQPFPPCWYHAITMATSRDSGRSYAQPSAPRHVVAASPYQHEPESGWSGYRAPSNIVLNPDDGYLYSIFTAREQGAQEGGSCLMRTSNPEDPQSWRAWSGDGFTIEFVNAYDEPQESPEDHTCEPISPGEVSGMWESLTYNEYLERFLLVGTATETDAETGRRLPGVYFSLSEDLIHWSHRRLIFEADFGAPPRRCDDDDPIAYPSLLDPGSESQTFATTGQRPYLYYTKVHYRGCLRTPNRDLLRIPLKVSK
jgi:hypothetical protein